MDNNLTAQDRCDRCGAQAYAKSIHGSLHLLWCAHHYREHYDKIVGHLVIDQTHLLAAPPKEPAST